MGSGLNPHNGIYTNEADSVSTIRNNTLSPIGARQRTSSQILISSSSSSRRSFAVAQLNYDDESQNSDLTLESVANRVGNVESSLARNDQKLESND